MVRLSEAIARANCVDEVSGVVPVFVERSLKTLYVQITPAFVKEAYSLLRQSIIHVEKDDVEVDDDDDDDPTQEASGAPATSQTGPGQSSPTRQRRAASSVPAPPPGGQAAAAPPAKRKIVLSYDEYQTILQLVVLHLQELERDTSRPTGLSRDALAQWYLEQIEEDISTMEELEEKRTLINKVISKLLKVRFPFSRVLYSFSVGGLLCMWMDRKMSSSRSRCSGKAIRRCGTRLRRATLQRRESCLFTPTTRSPTCDCSLRRV
jgi:DNA replication licensing factor MCM6